MTLIGAIIKQDGFLKIYKGKVMDYAGNEREVIVKISLGVDGSMDKMRLK
jgi:hypothetical protein